MTHQARVKPGTQTRTTGAKSLREEWTCHAYSQDSDTSPVCLHCWGPGFHGFLHFHAPALLPSRPPSGYSASTGLPRFPKPPQAALMCPGHPRHGEHTPLWVLALFPGLCRLPGWGLALPCSPSPPKQNHHPAAEGLGDPGHTPSRSFTQRMQTKHSWRPQRQKRMGSIEKNRAGAQRKARGGGGGGGLDVDLEAEAGELS